MHKTHSTAQDHLRAEKGIITRIVAEQLTVPAFPCATKSFIVFYSASEFLYSSSHVLFHTVASSR